MVLANLLFGWDLVFDGLDSAEEVGFVLGVKRHFSDDEDEKYHTASPNVGRLTVHHFLADQIWAHVMGGSTLYAKLLILRTGRRESKVNQLYLIL